MGWLQPTVLKRRCPCALVKISEVSVLRLAFGCDDMTSEVFSEYSPPTSKHYVPSSFLRKITKSKRHR